MPTGKQRNRLVDGGGLYLEVQPNGAKHWRWKYRFGGKEKRLALGSWPAVSIERARAERDIARSVLRSGADPLAHKRVAPSQFARIKKVLGVLLTDLHSIGARAEADQIEMLVLDLERFAAGA